MNNGGNMTRFPFVIKYFSFPIHIARNPSYFSEIQLNVNQSKINQLIIKNDLEMKMDIKEERERIHTNQLDPRLVCMFEVT